MKRFFVVITLCVLIFGCDSNRVFEDYHAVGSEGWHKDSLVIFNVDQSGLNQGHNIFINVRNRGDYSNSNLWLFIAINSPEGQLLTDTVEFVLAEPTGRWKGSGIGDLYDNQFLYKQNVIFPESGEYRFSIKQGMRSDILEGIHDVGLRIEKQN